MGNKDTDTTTLEDERLQKALMEAEKTKKLTPIIKEELRCSILARRWKENKGEIDLEEKKPIIKTVNSDNSDSSSWFIIILSYSGLFCLHLNLDIFCWGGEQLCPSTVYDAFADCEHSKKSINNGNENLL